MKVFIPMTDDALDSDGALYQRLVPFDPSFLESGQNDVQGSKPTNWISESDNQQARERLYATQA